MVPRHAANFQALRTHAQEQQSQGTSPGTKPRMQRLIERSVFSDRMVFVRAVHNAKWMSELELQVYDSWFNPIVSALPTVRRISRLSCHGYACNC